MVRFTRLVKAALGLACLAVSSACGGGSNAAVPPGASTARGTTSASVVIHIPAATAVQGRAVRPRFVSPSTKSISVAISPGASCTGCTAAQVVKADLTPGSASCPTTGSGTTCTIPLALNPGSYTAGITTYSGTQQSGFVLSSDAALPFTVVPNIANSIGFTLSGVPAGIAFSLAAPTPTATLTIVRLAAAGPATTTTLAVAIQDAQGNVITGPGAPTFTVAVSGGHGFTAQSTPGSNVVTITNPATGTLKFDTLTVTLNSPTCSLPNAVCSTTLSLQMQQIVAVGNWANSSVSVFALNGAPVSSTSGIVGNAIASPEALAFDLAGRLYVGNYNNAPQAAGQAPWPYGFSNFALLPGTLPGGGQSVAVPNGGGLFVAAHYNVYAYSSITSPPNAIPFALTTNPVRGIAFDALANMFMVDTSTSLYKFAPPYTQTAPPSATMGSAGSPMALAVDSHGNVWVPTMSGKILEFNPSLALIRTIVSPVSSLNGIAIDRFDNVAVIGPKDVYYYTAPSYIASAVATLPCTLAHSAVFDAYGDLLVGDAGVNTIRFFNYPFMSQTTTIGDSSTISDPSALAMWP